MKNYRIHVMWRNFYLLAFVIVLIFSSPLWGQVSFIVESTVPADGATSVDPNGTYEITFSKPLDTNVQFEYPPEFYINLVIHPDSLVGEPDSITIDPSLTTVYIHNLHLLPDTKYILFIADAVSMDQDSLAMPYVATFTTGTNLPTAKVSGTIAFADGNPQGTIVTLMDRPLFSDEGTESASVVVDSGGEYQIRYVPPGTYWPTALWNFYIAADGELSPGDNAAFGFYDQDRDMIQDSIVVSEGDSLADIDIVLNYFTPVTARQYYNTVADTATNWASDAALVFIAGPDISEQGTSPFWEYTFYSSTLKEFNSWMVIGSMVIPSNIMEIPLADTTALPDNWIDSDMATDTAEFYGGKQFREENQAVTVGAFLGYSFPFGDDENRFHVNKLLNNIEYVSGNKFSRPFSMKPGKTPYWFFFYFAQGQEEPFFLIVNAITGKVASEVTAREAENSASQEALQWATDSKLVGIMAPLGISEDGTASFWYFGYYSQSLDSLLGIITIYGIVFGTEAGHEPPSPEIILLPLNWIDSDSAMAVAEANGGTDYRATNQDVVVNAFLSAGIMFWEPDSVAWEFVYSSTTSAPLFIFIDPVTGEFLGPKILTAKVAEVVARDSAIAWASDAKLIGVGTSFDDSIDPQGRATYWGFGYHSDSLNTFLNVFTMYDNVIMQWPFFDAWPYADQPLPSNWLNSDSAAFIAENNGGADFRNSHATIRVDASLRRGDYAADLFRPVWHFVYHAQQDSLHIYFDAVSGEILTKVENPYDMATLPIFFDLKQNFPNPFNPDTKINYSIPKSSHVKITVYNILGEQIAILLDDQKEAGNYVITWNGKDGFNKQIPSGIYFYKMEAGNYKKILKMTLVR